MNSVFADTPFWIALLNSRDCLHVIARELDASPHIERFVTTEMVLAEFLGEFGARNPALARAALRFVNEIRRAGNVDVIPHTTELFWEAVQLFSERMGNALTVTDCLSLLVMQEHGIREVLSHDRHFEKAGCRALLREAAF